MALDRYAREISTSPHNDVIVGPDGVPLPSRQSIRLDPSLAASDDGNATVIASASYDDIRRTSEGMIAETFPRILITAGTILVGGTAYFSSIPLRKGTLVSNITVAVNTPGVSMTLSKLGLYDTAGNRLTVSADQAAAWESSGLKTAPVTPYTVPTTGRYFVGLIGAGGTLPVIMRTGLVIPQVSGLAFGSNAPLLFSLTGKSDLDATVTVAAPASTSFLHWAGIT